MDKFISKLFSLYEYLSSKITSETNADKQECPICLTYISENKTGMKVCSQCKNHIHNECYKNMMVHNIHKCPYCECTDINSVQINRLIINHNIYNIRNFHNIPEPKIINNCVNNLLIKLPKLPNSLNLIRCTKKKYKKYQIYPLN